MTTMPFAKLSDGQLRYQLDGPANTPVVLFSNSLGTNFRMWDAQLSDFTQQFRVLRYDTRGHGESTVTPGPYNITQLGRDVLHLLDTLSLERVHFCGLSMGGMTGMELASHSPNRVRKLVICSSGAKLGTADTWNTRIETVQKNGMKPVAAAAMERWFTSQFRSAHPDQVSAAQQMLETTSPEGYIANCSAVRDFDFRQNLPSIKVPTLVISSTHDPVAPPADGHFLQKTIPHALYAELDASHISNIEARVAFNQAILPFLRA
jgi:3-oxoadipate enol-lactonase